MTATRALRWGIRNRPAQPKPTAEVTTPVPCSSRTGDIAQNLPPRRKRRLASALDGFIDVHGPAIEQSAARCLLQVDGEVIGQMSGPQVLAAAPHVAERVRDQPEDFEDRGRLRPNRAHVEGG